jgi:hypothetical protein
MLVQVGHILIQFIKLALGRVSDLDNAIEISLVDMSRMSLIFSNGGEVAVGAVRGQADLCQGITKT